MRNREPDRRHRKTLSMKRGSLEVINLNTDDYGPMGPPMFTLLVSPFLAKESDAGAIHGEAMQKWVRIDLSADDLEWLAECAEFWRAGND